MPLNHEQKLAYAALAEKARRRGVSSLEDRLSNFVREAWPTVVPASPYVHGRHIDAICEHLEAVLDGQIRHLLINVPPRFAKSTIVTVMFPCWAWAKKPEIRWLFASYAESLSIRDSLACRRLIQSAWYQERWGDRFGIVVDQNEKRRFENSKMGVRLSTSVDGTNTGEGGDIQVADDPNNLREISSEASRLSAITWWDQVMSTRLNDPRTSARVVIQQRGHEEDLSGHILETSGVQFDHLCLPMEYDGRNKTTSIGWQDWRTKDGELLWPERFGPEEVARLKSDLKSGAAGQLQQLPAPESGD